jgi:NADPH:quinone reductase-like Zn-dependent oxidoreductase
MKAVVIHEHGDLDVLRIEEREKPTPRADEVLIEVKAIGLNHLDTWVRRGVPGHTFPLPMIPGCDGAGVIAETGSLVDWLQVGDRVAIAPGLSCGHCPACTRGTDNHCPQYGILGETQDGSCAEYIAVPARNALPIPDQLDFPQAAAFPLTFLTAWHMLVARCGITPSDTVLVHAAGSGVGSAAVQIAKLHHAQVIATAGTEEKRAQAVELGADHVLPSREGDLAKSVRELTGKRGVDIVFEHVGEATMPASLRCLARNGRLVTCGATTGPKLEADLRHLFFKNLSILGSTMGSRSELIHILDLVGRGLLKPVVDRVLPLEQIGAAHQALHDRKAFGKIILVPDSSNGVSP